MPTVTTNDAQDSDADDDRVVTVQLSQAKGAQQAFLRKLQDALGEDASLGSLTSGPGEDVFVIPGTAEALLRRKLQLPDDDALEALLRSYGALTVNALHAQALFALMYRGAVVLPGGPVGATKITKIQAPAKSALQGAAAVSLPKDFRGPYDWNLGPRGANVVEAWQMFAAHPSHSAQLPWKDVRVAHIDTGYTEHAALGWDGGASMTVDVGRGSEHWPQKDEDPRDEWLPGFPGHGTRISAAIAGFLPQAPGSPFYGVAPGVQIVPYRVTDSVIVDHVQSAIADAILEAVADDCHIVNVSLGALRGDRRVAEALDTAYEHGLIVCCAAGQVWPRVIYPGRFNRCMTMGGVGPDFKPWASGATGRHVDLCGPADAIRRVKAEKRTPGDAAQAIYPKPEGDGTSYATATCSGVAALWLAWHQVDALRERYANSGRWQIPAVFKALARASSTPGKWPAGSNSYGSGVINAAALLMLELPDDGVAVKAAAADAGFDPND
ncbi:S8/S53 family peptidase [Variovorax sp. WS11]|uniref:S8 family peptidase n=1 Tax=Variovorax sp. WS11 TaxID=1105204 RepID=UPI0013D91E99|nr:S8/S53 family peptidase [Variovorax sp. WS11]NDZ16989.1 S8/S53 family peptidase [Variovorax sp. WS11]